MNRDAAWFVLVLLLGARLLAVMVLPEDEANEVVVENNEASCPDGTEQTLNASSSTGYDCVYPDPHSLAHTHPVGLAPNRGNFIQHDAGRSQPYGSFNGRVREWNGQRNQQLNQRDR